MLSIYPFYLCSRVSTSDCSSLRRRKKAEPAIRTRLRGGHGAPSPSPVATIRWSQKTLCGGSFDGAVGPCVPMMRSAWIRLVVGYSGPGHMEFHLWMFFFHTVSVRAFGLKLRVQRRISEVDS